MQLRDWLLQTVTALIAPTIIYLYWRLELRPIVYNWSKMLDENNQHLRRLQGTADTTYQHLGLFVDAYGSQMRDLKEELRTLRIVYAQEVDRKRDGGH